MLKRTITGFFILLATASFILLREVSLLFFDAFILLITFGAVFEMIKASKVSNKKIEKVLLCVYPVILACIFIFTSGELSLLLILSALLLMFVILMAKELIVNSIKRKKSEENVSIIEQNMNLLNETKHTLEIMVYPTTLLSFLFGINHFGLNVGYVGIIITFAVSMLTDVFAYLFGSMLKGPKFAPEISPKKSISGMIFGALGGMLASGLGYLFFVHMGLVGNVFSTVNTGLTIMFFIVSGVVGTFLTQFGDLVASAYKRKAQIKDFGSIFPGHGGFMDRVDGLMFTGSLVYVLLSILF